MPEPTVNGVHDVMRQVGDHHKGRHADTHAAVHQQYADSESAADTGETPSRPVEKR